MQPPPLAALNGDLPLSPAQRRDYLAFHAHRNRENARLSGVERIATRPVPLATCRPKGPASPARLALADFFTFAARTLAPHFRGRDVCILDLGCGGGACLPFFEGEGYRGWYVGLDIARSPRWSDSPTPAFRKRLIVGDINTLDVHDMAPGLPPVDLLVSSTSLEHIRDDAGAIARLRTLLAPDAAQAHFVPGEGALPLYLCHGWRQYSPRCLRAIFPHAEFFRCGGPCSALLHKHCITRPVNAERAQFGARHPRLYKLAVTVAVRVDRLLANRPAIMYGVLERPHASPPGVARAA